jgi:hypothetical protein
MSKNSISLDLLDVKSPCTYSWDAMQGNGRTRFCPQCQLSVYNVSEMSVGEITDLIRRKEGRLCIRLVRRGDGTLVTGDFRRSRSFARAFALAMSLVVLAFVAVFGSLLVIVGAIDAEKHRSTRSLNPFAFPKQNGNDSKECLGSATVPFKPEPVNHNDMANPRER